ncbi:hypothetical protein BpHYR1_053151 [Brachionus plicatilis]|uniref:Uncharacterized protein n=1 Tax=Brachionus plicatilis TaxID=10195 RepID=A0A3M7QBY4_BRAPC|nr:hypothetical protein BpHYR1_053151 [Brachionus plicatilis]
MFIEKLASQSSHENLINLDYLFFRQIIIFYLFNRLKCINIVIFLCLLVGFYSPVRLPKSNFGPEGFGSNTIWFFNNFIGTRGSNPKPKYITKLNNINKNN